MAVHTLAVSFEVPGAGLRKVMGGGVGVGGWGSRLGGWGLGGGGVGAAAT